MYDIANEEAGRAEMDWGNEQYWQGTIDMMHNLLHRGHKEALLSVWHDRFTANQKETILYLLSEGPGPGEYGYCEADDRLYLTLTE